MKGFASSPSLGNPSTESTVVSCSGPVQFPGGFARVSRTLRRSTQSIRRISTASAARGLPFRSDKSSASTASSSWYSSSQVDLILISRNRANSLDPEAPHPSTILKTIDSPEEIICFFNEPLSVRGKERAARRTASASSCARRHTMSRRKSCIPTASHKCQLARTQSGPRIIQSFLLLELATQGLALSTITDFLSTQNLDSAALRPNSPRHYSARTN